MLFVSTKNVNLYLVYMMVLVYPTSFYNNAPFYSNYNFCFILVLANIIPISKQPHNILKDNAI